MTRSTEDKQLVDLWTEDGSDLPAVDEVGRRVEESTFHRVGVVGVLSGQNHPLLRVLALKHLPLLRRTHQQHKVR